MGMAMRCDAMQPVLSCSAVRARLCCLFSSRESCDERLSCIVLSSGDVTMLVHPTTRHGAEREDVGRIKECSAAMHRCVQEVQQLCPKLINLPTHNYLCVRLMSWLARWLQWL